MEDRDAAMALYRDGKWAEAQIAFSANATNSAFTVDQRANSAYWVAQCAVKISKSYVDPVAVSIWESQIPDVTISRSSRLNALCAYARSLYQSGRPVESLALLDANLPAFEAGAGPGDNVYLNCIWMKVTLLRRAGDNLRASQESVRCATACGFISLEHQEKCWEQVDFVALGVEEAKSYMQNLLLIVPAVEENTAFLGMVKSKLELLK